ncbi:M20 family metallopeptidase [Terrarubrum flagellatum]|uniref:M20 family metallopeptidase n=1 Tax=Terrirubrum flagellatum TaxID=2895980 RepID=UPI003144DE57
MTRAAAIAAAHAHFDSGAFKSDLARRLAIPTESQNPDRAADLRRYLEEEMIPALTAMGFSTRILTNPNARGPFLFAERIEDPAALTVLGYGHGDVIRGLDAMWKPGLSPWALIEKDGRWYGRGVVDNKGQHAINLAAQAQVLKERGKLGFNAKWLIEMGEETGSPGLREVCAEHRDLFKADLLIASDGPRLSAERPTLFLGARGGMAIDLEINAREGGHHSGNWGGLLSNPGILLSHAIASIVGPNGQIRLHELVPDHIPKSVRRALADCVVDGGPDGPEIEPWWGEPGLTASEKVFGWCNFEVLAFECGTPATPVNAIPPRAWARCQLRFVVGVDPMGVAPAIRRHLDRQGLGMVKVSTLGDERFGATRLDPDHPYVRWAAKSFQETSGKKPAILPNLGGGLPNDIFAHLLGLPTVWAPHSYPGCSQHAPNEHVPIELVREALGLMAGLYWDLGESDFPRIRS